MSGWRHGEQTHGAASVLDAPEPPVLARRNRHGVVVGFSSVEPEHGTTCGVVYFAVHAADQPQVLGMRLERRVIGPEEAAVAVSRAQLHAGRGAIAFAPGGIWRRRVVPRTEAVPAPPRVSRHWPRPTRPRAAPPAHRTPGASAPPTGRAATGAPAGAAVQVRSRASPGGSRSGRRDGPAPLAHGTLAGVSACFCQRYKLSTSAGVKAVL